MTSTLLLMLPVSWVYRAIHEGSVYDHSIDTTALVLPAVVACIVTVVQHSLALAFSLAGIAVVLTVFFNYACISVCAFGDGLESQHVAYTKIRRKGAKAAKALEKEARVNSNGPMSTLADSRGFVFGKAGSVPASPGPTREYQPSLKARVRPHRPEFRVAGTVRDSSGCAPKLWSVSISNMPYARYSRSSFCWDSIPCWQGDTSLSLSCSLNSVPLTCDFLKFSRSGGSSQYCRRKLPRIRIDTTQVAETRHSRLCTSIDRCATDEHPSLVAHRSG